jgi:hypothetical protein
MKYLKPFDNLNESTKFTHMKEVLDTIEDMCLDIKDEGFETLFGIMPTGDNVANFDTYYDDIQIKLASLGKRIMYVKFDISKNLDKFKDENVLEIFIDTFMRVYNYLLSEDLIVKGFWTNETTLKNQNSPLTRSNFFHFDKINNLINHIDWVRTEKLKNKTEQLFKSHRPEYYFRLLNDVRIVFTGQPIEDLLENKKIESEISELRKDLEQILLPLKDSGYDVNIYSNYDSKDKINEIGCYIRTDTKIDINDEFISCLQEAVSFMNSNDYFSISKYHTYHSLPQKFYIYTDSRQLRAGGSKMDQNWPNCFKITIDFYSRETY